MPQTPRRRYSAAELIDSIRAPNRLRLPAYYELHVWAWKRNSTASSATDEPAVHVRGTRVRQRAAARDTRSLQGGTFQFVRTIEAQASL